VGNGRDVLAEGLVAWNCDTEMKDHADNVMASNLSAEPKANVSLLGWFEKK
jgi:hypothetical protein